MRNEDLLTELDRRLKDQRVFFGDRMTGLSGTMRDKFDEAKEDRKEIIKHQKTTNSRVGRLEKQTGFIRWAGRNPQYSIPLVLVLGFGLYFLVAYLGIEFLFRL